MRLKYCKPETEVDLLVLEECILSYDNVTNTPDIEDDLDNPGNPIAW